MGVGRRRCSWGVLVGVCALAAGGVALWRTSDLGRAAGELERQKAAARREGLPLEYDELRRLAPPVPEEDNAAIPYARAFATLGERPLKDLKPENLLRGLPAGRVETDDLAKHQKALAAAGPGWRT